MTAEEFLDSLEERGLLPGDVLANIRGHMERSIKVFTPESLAKLLIDKRLLTSFQAEQLLNEGSRSKPAAAEEDLGLAPLENESRSKKGAASPKSDGGKRPEAAKKSVPAEDEMGLAPLDEMPSRRPAPQPPSAAPKPAPNKQSPAKPAAASKSSPAGKPAAPADWKQAGAGSSTSSVKRGSQNKDQPSGGPTATPLAEIDDPGLSPLDDLLANPLLSDASSMQGNPLMPTASRREPIPKWIWFSGAGILLVICAVVLIVKLTRSNGDLEWQSAEKDYQAAKDQEAIDKLADFLERFPRHAKSSLARVYRGTARLRQVFAVKGDWEQSLTVAREVLPQMVGEPEFPKVRDELAKMLPEMAVGLVKQAQATANRTDEQRLRRVDLAREGLTLAEDWRFVPDSLKPWSQLQAAEDNLAMLERDLTRETDLDRVAGEIHAAVAAGNLAEAFGRRDQLLGTYPELRTNATFETLAGEMFHAAGKLVKVSANARKAETKDRSSPIAATIVLATAGQMPTAVKKSGDDAATDPLGSDPAGAAAGSDVVGGAASENLAVCALADGSAYGLSAGSGRVLWRRYVGTDSFPPLAVGGPSGTDFILVDTVHHELLRVGGGGKLVWRQSLEDPAATPPREIGSHLFLATRSGRLLMIEATTGELIRTAQLPQPAATSPAVSADGTMLYLPADRAGLYILSAKDLSCVDVFPLGQESGAIRTPPVVMDRYLIVAENRGLDNSVLRVVSLGPQGTALKVVQEVALSGEIAAAPAVDNGHLSLVTDQGVVGVFALTGPAQSPLARLGEGSATGGAHLVQFPLAAGGRLYVAGNGVACYEADPSAGTLVKKWERLAGHVTVEPPVIGGQRLIVACRRSGIPGTWFAALSAERGEQAWEVGLGIPLAGAPVKLSHAESDPRVVAMNALGGCYDATPAFGQEKIVWPQPAMPNPAATGKAAEPAVANGLESAMIGDVTRLKDGQFAAVVRPRSDHREGTAQATGRESAPRLAVYMPPADPSGGWSRIASPWADIPSSAPVVMGDGILVAGKEGQMFLIDPRTGQQLAAPFQPRWQATVQLAWRRPGVVADPVEAVVTDGRTGLYRLAIKEKPVPQLAALAEASLTVPIVTGIAIAGDSAFGADGGGNLSAYKLPDLKPAKSWPLAGSVVWGPERSGTVVLVATERELYCFDSRPEMIWHKPLAYGWPVGLPLERGDDIVLASASGMVWRITRQAGEEHGKADLGQPLAGGPTIFQKYLVLPGQDGTLHFISPP